LIAVDTNILVYAHRVESPWNHLAKPRLAELAEARGPWAIPWPCLHEFLGFVTHPRICDPPTRLAEALRQVEYWMESPSLVLLTEGPGYWTNFRAIMIQGSIAGPRTHDARIAALCREHGVSTLWSADRDFSRFTGLRVVNPLLK
jgi:toxin-antitoxin system PIN domain toxin